MFDKHYDALMEFLRYKQSGIHTNDPRFLLNFVLQITKSMCELLNFVHLSDNFFYFFNDLTGFHCKNLTQLLTMNRSSYIKILTFFKHYLDLI